MLTSNQLKALLMKIKDNDFAVPAEADAFEIAMNMMNYIGHTDSELRDKLIYRIFYEWFKKRVFTEQQMMSLLNSSMDEAHLFYRIGDIDTDSVFTRAFSVLIIPLVLLANREKEFLTKQDVLHIKMNILRYVFLEHDLRGYVEYKGWADARCHMADAIADIAKADYLGKEDLLDLLNAVKDKITIGESPCACEEDERFATAFMSIYERGIMQDHELSDWLDSFNEIPKKHIMPYDLYLYNNNKSFLRSIYFRLLFANGSATLIERIKEILFSTYHH